MTRAPARTAEAASARGSRFRRLLPLVLVAAMVAIALAIEGLVQGDLLLAPKLPLVVLLLWAFVRDGRRSGG